MIGFSFESLNNLSSDNQNNTSSQKDCSQTQTENEDVEIISEDNSLVVSNNTTNKGKGFHFKCKECGKKFSSTAGLKSHMKNHSTRNDKN